MQVDVKLMQVYAEMMQVDIKMMQVYAEDAGRC